MIDGPQRVDSSERRIDRVVWHDPGPSKHPRRGAALPCGRFWNVLTFDVFWTVWIPLRISTTKWVNSCWLQMAKTYEFCSATQWLCHASVAKPQEKQCVNKMFFWRCHDIDLVGMDFVLIIIL